MFRKGGWPGVVFIKLPSRKLLAIYSRLKRLQSHFRLDACSLLLVTTLGNCRFNRGREF